SKEIARTGKPWCAGVDYPSIDAIVTPNPVFHAKGLMTFEGRFKHLQATVGVRRVNAAGPANAQFLIEGATCKFQPLLIEIRRLPVDVGDPNHDRSSISHLPKTFFTF